ncbi:hypothetical protein [Jonesia quinghaiensis]|uniref:hypothetical protein n=1 Tax=Jonesia quinghaiensis TaxID=262806 RepID=UPI000425C41F|nr:hypothetical protein [Jonesia quinghaiensis]
MSILPRLAISGAVTLGATLTLSACSSGPHYSETLTSAAAEHVAAQSEGSQTPLTFPHGEGTGAPIPDWTSLLVVCPYADTSNVEEPYASALSTVDTARTDAYQWLVFTDETDAELIIVKRVDIDLCENSDAIPIYTPDTTMTAEHLGNMWIMRRA